MITLVRNDDYWGDKAKVKKLIFKTISDENARKQELRPARSTATTYPRRPTGKPLQDRGLQRADPAGVQHPLPGHQPEEQPGAEGPAGAPGDRLRDQPRVAGAQPAARGRRWSPPSSCRTPSTATPPTCSRTRTTRTKAKQLLAEAGAVEPDAQVLLPDRGHPAVHAEPDRTSSPRWRRTCRRSGITVKPVPQPWNGGYLDACRPPAPTTCTCSAGPVTTTTPATSSAPSSAPAEAGVRAHRPGAVRRGRRGRRGGRPGRARGGVRAGQPRPDDQVPAGGADRSSPPALVVRKNITGLIPQPADRRAVRHGQQGLTAVRPRVAPPAGGATLGDYARAAPAEGGLMLRFIVRRLLQLIPTLLVLSVLLFVWLRRAARRPGRGDPRRPGHPGADRRVQPPASVSTSRSASSTASSWAGCSPATSAPPPRPADPVLDRDRSSASRPPSSWPSRRC